MLIYGRPGAHGATVLRRLSLRLIGGSILFIVVTFSALNLLISPKKDLLIYIGLSVAVGLLSYLGLGLEKIYVKYQQYNAGVKAEKSVYRALRTLRPEVLINGLAIPSIGDCDHIFIKGTATLIETKAGRGMVSYRDNKIHIRNQAMPRDPIAQINKQGRVLSEKYGLDVKKIICIPGAENSISIGDVLITNLEGLKIIKNLTGNQVSERTKKALIETFNKK